MAKYFILAAIVVGIPAFLLGRHGTVLPWLRPGAWRGRFKLWQACLAILAAGLLFSIAIEHPFGLVVGGLIVLAVLAWSWHQEFVFLMSLHDDDFPGRYDKAIWAFLMIALAPVGLWLFRSYHLAQWPEPEAELPPGKAAPDYL